MQSLAFEKGSGIIINEIKLDNYIDILSKYIDDSMSIYEEYYQKGVEYRRENDRKAKENAHNRALEIANKEANKDYEYSYADDEIIIS